MESTCIRRWLIERFTETKCDLHMVVIDLGKAYDRIPRKLIRQILQKKHVHKWYIDAIKDMYKNHMRRNKHFSHYNRFTSRVCMLTIFVCFGIDDLIKHI